MGAPPPLYRVAHYLCLDEGNGGGGGRARADVEEIPLWMRRLVAEDFSKRCVRDRVCVTCAAAFCGHCCGEHHHGHDTAAAAAPPRTREDEEVRRHRRDSFCVGCGMAFCAALCGHLHHHDGGDGHEVIRVDEYGTRHYVRCTGQERWFSHFDGIETFRDDDDNMMVPLEPKRDVDMDLLPGLRAR